MFRQRIYTPPGSEQYLVLGVEVVEAGLVLVRSKCLDKQICFAPKSWIRPGSELMHSLNRVKDTKY